MPIQLPTFPVLKIRTLNDLIAHESDILQRITESPRGGPLFLTSPLDLLNDLNVQLSKAVVDALIKQTPTLAGTSRLAYDALKKSDIEPITNVRVQGLFEGIKK